jgi:serine phosphatase RsbU (regulator of sigma subunit)
MYVSVSDCTGHGVPGAFMSIIGNNLIEKAIVEKRIERPADVLKFMSEGINNQLGMTSGSSDVKDGMDMTLVCIDKDTNKLSFSGARNPLYFLRDGQLEEIKATKLSVGYNSTKADADFENLEIDLLKGDRLYMFSDGFADQKGGPKGKKFYYRPFREILQGTGSESMEFQRNLLETTIVEWMNGAEQLDDMLILGIEI